MKVRIIQAWDTLRSSYWFIPSLMALGAVLLSEIAIRSQGALTPEWLRRVDWLYENQPDGARALLSTVAGSMITVAGVTFSMTILAISHASAQIGPRLLTDFMRDRGNQVTLGTFIATFIYCLLVLRTVRAADPSVTGQALEAFVPQVAVLLALVLAVWSVGVLIYFIHHVPATLSMTNLLDRVSCTLSERIDAIYPTELGEPAEQRPRRELGEPLEILAADGGAGYVCYTDDDGLIETARECDVVVELLARPGDFISHGRDLARIYGQEKIDDDARARLRGAFVTGSERTPQQDVLFPAMELVEVAVRALSPGVNDPYTAVRCIDLLEVAMLTLARREPPDPERLDEQGRLRVLAYPVRFDEFVSIVCDGLRPHAAREPASAVHLLRMLGSVRARLPKAVGCEAIDRQIAAVRASAELALEDPRDRQRILEAVEAGEATARSPRSASAVSPS